MKLGMVGVGRMGGNMVLRLLRDGHECAVFDTETSRVESLVKAGAAGASSLEELVSMLKRPRALWVMLPAGPPTEETITALADLMGSGDLIVDGGNSYYKEDARKKTMLEKRGIEYLDVGLSGGIWGLEHGYSIMIGGKESAVRRLEPVFRSLAPSPDRGWARVGPTGAGHYVKMVHNGMIYGLLQAYAEGFELLESKKEYDLDLHKIADSWRYGSVARSWLLDIIASALEKDQTLEDVAPYVADSGEGRWTVMEAIELNRSVPVISISLMRRLRSREEAPYGDRLIAKLRNIFGGHEYRDASSSPHT
jgi:6-phosphogluconate dehydrogenase